VAESQVLIDYVECRPGGVVRIGIAAQGSRVVSVDLCPGAGVFGQEGQRTLKLQEQITKLFTELRQPVYRYLLCLGLSSSEAEEITQETFFRLYRHLHASGTEVNLRGWVFRVAHNIGINELKRRKWVVGVSSEQWAELIASNGAQGPTPEELLQRKEKLARVHAAVATLSEQQKECLYLRAEGFRYREIAEVLGVTVSTVVESLRRAIKKLSKESHASAES
jgi:RNA polymerase sigma-70 factor (ECF subfamily)